MRTRIIAGFPGVGKSTFVEKNPALAIDADSSQFSWMMSMGVRIRNPSFPANYIERIKSLIGTYEIIFVSTHKEVREVLRDNCIFYYLSYPDKRKKAEYLARYAARGNDDAFVKLLDKNWDAWIEELQQWSVGCDSYQMDYPFIGEEIDEIIRRES